MFSFLGRAFSGHGDIGGWGAWTAAFGPLSPENNIFCWRLSYWAGCCENKLKFETLCVQLSLVCTGTAEIGGKCMPLYLAIGFIHMSDPAFWSLWCLFSRSCGLSVESMFFFASACFFFLSGKSPLAERRIFLNLLSCWWSDFIFLGSSWSFVKKTSSALFDSPALLSFVNLAFSRASGLNFISLYTSSKLSTAPFGFGGLTLPHIYAFKSSFSFCISFSREVFVCLWLSHCFHTISAFVCTSSGLRSLMAFVSVISWLRFERWSWKNK